MNLWKALFFIACIVLSHQAFAQNVVDFGIHNSYVSPRAQGMGGAFGAVVDDHSAIFYNPAALARRTDGNMHFSLKGTLDTAYVDLIDDLDAAGEETNDTQAISNLLQDNYGNAYYSRIPTIGASWVRPNWGIAFIPLDLTLDMSIRRSIGPAIALNAYVDSILAYSYARNVKWGQKGQLSVGATVKLINRVQASEAVGIFQLAGDSDVFDEDTASEGLFGDLDIGFLYTPKLPNKGWLSWMKVAEPSFSLTVRNLVDSGPLTNLGVAGENSADAPRLQRRLDLGSKWDLPDFWVFDPKMAVDFRNMLHDNWTFQKGNHLGFELYWKMFSWWKGYWSVGLNQWAPDDLENLSLGFGAHLAWFQLDLATWQEYLGTDDVAIRSRRFMVEMSVDF